MFQFPNIQIFNGERTALVSENLRRAAIEFVDQIPPENILKSEVDQLVELVLSKFELGKLEIGTTEHVENQSSSDVLWIKFHIPCKGSWRLLRCQPMVGLHIPVFDCSILAQGNGKIVFTVKGNNEERIKKEISIIETFIKTGITQLNTDAAAFDLQMATEIRAAIERRKEVLIKHQKIIDALPYALVKREKPTQAIQIPMERKLPKIDKVDIKSPNSIERYYFLPGAEYDFILELLFNMSRALEYNPRIFENFDEEALRWILLIPLNGYYGPQATGETFHVDGKTDILISHEGDHVFVAECKIWDGEKTLSDAIDQLLGYVHWRDTKTAIIIFSRNKSFSSVLKQIEPTVLNHAHCVGKVPGYERETCFRFTMKNRNDSDRHFTLTVMVFDVSNS